MTRKQYENLCLSMAMIVADKYDVSAVEWIVLPDWTLEVRFSGRPQSEAMTFAKSDVVSIVNMSSRTESPRPFPTELALAIVAVILAVAGVVFKGAL